jgi:glycosyltransferase involved in cell wall biosynthesis
MTLLCRALRARRHDVTFFGFTRQYPAWLYPGQTDKDPSQAALVEDVVPILDSLNPISWVRTALRIRREQPDWLILPWWTSFWTPQYLTIAALVRQSKRTKILFICHNVVEHETNAVKQLGTRSVLRLGDHFIVHSDEDLRQLNRIVPGAPVSCVLHPTYGELINQRVDQDEARRRLGVDGRTLLFFGFVRPYKGLEYAIRSLPLILKKYPATLLIAGEFWIPKEPIERLIAELGIASRVRLMDRYIPNEEIGPYFSAADLLLLPYVSATQSGIAQIAYSLDLPVVASRVGGFLDIVEHGKTGYLVEPGNPAAIAEAVIDFYDHQRREALTAGIKAVRDRFSWDWLVTVIELLNH